MVGGEAVVMGGSQEGSVAHPTLQMCAIPAFPGQGGGESAALPFSGPWTARGLCSH